MVDNKGVLHTGLLYEPPYLKPPLKFHLCWLERGMGHVHINWYPHQDKPLWFDPTFPFVRNNQIREGAQCNVVLIYEPLPCRYHNNTFENRESNSLCMSLTQLSFFYQLTKKPSISVYCLSEKLPFMPLSFWKL